MRSNDALRACGDRTDARDGDGGRVDCEDDVFGTDRIDLRVDLPLDIPFLGGVLDDEINIRKQVVILSKGDALEAYIPDNFFLSMLKNGIRDINKDHVMSRLSQALGDAYAHDTSSNNAYCSNSHNPFLIFKNYVPLCLEKR